MPCRQAQPHAFLRSLYQQVRDLQPDFPSSDEIRRLGVQVSKVSPADTDDGTLEFKPCYFKPHPDKLFEIYPIHPELEAEQHPDPVPPVRTVQDLMDEWPTKYPLGTAPILANLKCAELEDYELDRIAFDQAQEVNDVIDSHLTVTRQGPPSGGPFDYLSLDELRDQEPWE